MKKGGRNRQKRGKAGRITMNFASPSKVAENRTPGGKGKLQNHLQFPNDLASLYNGKV